ncbi:MAG: D-alanyl-D-alanine carboxypeptidase family protein [Candidatus Paracaedibacter sp.]|jgi:D-alanyl-D-alanine carboxypeptidase (penicillin-binding protein 5/6)
MNFPSFIFFRLLGSFSHGIKSFLLISGIFVLSINPGEAAKAKQAPPVKKVQKLDQPPPPELSSDPSKLSLGTAAKQALMIDYTTGVVLLEKNADELMFPSSMTKIMTAYLVFQKLKEGHIQMDTAFPVSERAWRMSGSKMFVPLNAMVKVEDLLKGIIIQSGNDACIVMAEGLSGSEEIFAQKMTHVAHEMGAVQTSFKNASGWPDPEHHTTARDLAIIAHRLITDYPEFYSLFGVKEYVYSNIRQWNRNPLLYKNIGCDGIKTGFTESGGYGIVASVVQGQRRLLLVVNGLSSEQERASEVLKLMTWGMQTFNNYSLFKPGELVDTIPISLGKENSVSATVAEEVIITLPTLSRKGLKVEVHYDSPVAAPIEKNAVLGKMSIYLPSQEQPIEVPLIASASVDRAGFFKKIKDSMSYLIWGKI